MSSHRNKGDGLPQMSAESRGEASQRTCVFCGSHEPLTGEHVFGDWLSRIGLDDAPVEAVAGKLNQLGKRMGLSRPFRAKVKNVCAACNSGWMSELEKTAKRALTSLILGEPGQIRAEDSGAVAAWALKTAYMAMYLSTAEDRASGHGVPAEEYWALYAMRAQKEPLPETMFWTGRYTGHLRFGSVWVTPVAVGVRGLSEPEEPHGYAITLVLGSLLIHGLRFTHLPFAVDLAAKQGLREFWPGSDEGPLQNVASDHNFLALAQAREFVLAEPQLTLGPLASLMDSPPSEQVGSMLRMPTPCGNNHFVYYPAYLAHQGMRGKYHWFYAACPCATYLVRTERDGAHVKSAGKPDRVLAEFDQLPGPLLQIGPFSYKKDVSS